MTSHTVLRSIAAGLAALVLGACSTVEQGPTVAAIDPVTSSEQADARLVAVAAERAAIEARFAEREAVCYDKFLVNNCLDEAQERRRTALAAQRNIEIEAERFKRRVKVEERDRDIAAAEAQYKAEEAALAGQPAVAPKEATALPPAKPSPAASRMARRKAKAQEEAARAPQEAAKAAANAAAFEERKRKAEQKQKDVAQRVAEREAKAARKKADAEKAKAAVPAGK